MSRGPDAGTLLRRALERYAGASGCTVTLSLAESSRWASATFIGARHRLTLEGDDDGALSKWLGGLSEADLPVRGQLVADVVVVSVARVGGRVAAVIESLTVEV